MDSCTQRRVIVLPVRVAIWRERDAGGGRNQSTTGRIFEMRRFAAESGRPGDRECPGYRAFPFRRFCANEDNCLTGVANPWATPAGSRTPEARPFAVHQARFQQAESRFSSSTIINAAAFGMVGVRSARLLCKFQPRAAGPRKSRGWCLCGAVASPPG